LKRPLTDLHQAFHSQWGYISFFFFFPLLPFRCGEPGDQLIPSVLSICTARSGLFFSFLSFLSCQETDFLVCFFFVLVKSKWLLLFWF
jgi:hypothetical protein